MTARQNEVERNRDQERCAQYQVALQESGPTELVEKCSLQQRDGGMQHAFPLLCRAAFRFTRVLMGAGWMCAPPEWIQALAHRMDFPIPLRLCRDSAPSCVQPRGSDGR